MRNRKWMSTWLLAACLPTLALAQQPAAPRGAGTWEFSAGGGVKIMDNTLLDYLASGPDSTRFTDTGDPSKVVPAIALRLGWPCLSRQCVAARLPLAFRGRRGGSRGSRSGCVRGAGCRWHSRGG